MSELSSSVLIVGSTLPAHNNLEVQSVMRLTDLSPNEATQVDVLILPILMALSDEIHKYVHLLQTQNSALQLILIAPKGTAVADLQEALSQLPVYHIAESLHESEIEPPIVAALELARQLRQNHQLERLVQEQNERLRQLQKDLEDRVRKRQTFLEESRSKLQIAHERWSLLLQVTEAVQLSESLGDIEQAVSQALGETFQLIAARIYPHPQDQLFREQQRQQRAHALFEASLRPRDDGLSMGSMFFLRKPTQPFRKDEGDFLQKIGEVISLAIDRLYQFEQNLALQEHWQATFNAVSDPVLILNTRYEVVQANAAFAKWPRRPEQKRCYEILFDRGSPCPQCRLGEKFFVDAPATSGKTIAKNFEVYSQRLQEPTAREQLYVHQYHEVTEQLQMEQKILEATRLAEMGAIGSSVAHELNNPLGGMLSFAQLIQMDLPPQHPFSEDLRDLEVGIKRCRDIVQNLLKFSRNPDQDEKTRVDLRDVVDRAVKILELQSRAAGIEIKITRPADPVFVEGFAGYLAQALQNILHHSLQSILDQTKANKGFRGLIEVQVLKSNHEAFVNVLDNGLASETWSTLGLSVAQQILRDHGGILEFLPDQRPFHVAKITLPQKMSRPESPN